MYLIVYKGSFFGAVLLPRVECKNSWHIKLTKKWVLPVVWNARKSDGAKKMEDKFDKLKGPNKGAREHEILDLLTRTTLLAMHLAYRIYLNDWPGRNWSRPCWVL